MKNFTLLISLFFWVMNSTYTQNNALQFDGSDDRVTGTISALPQGNAARTIEAWIKYTTGNDKAIFNYGTDQDNQVFALHLYNGVYIVSYNNDISTGFTVNDGSWHHLAVTHDGTTTKVYVDGIERGSKTTTYNTTGTNFQIGTYLRGTYGYNYNGTIDEVRVWNIARTQAQIQATMNSELSSGTGLIAAYHFNQGIAGGNNSGITTLIDATGSYNGTLTNFALSGTTSNWVGGNVVLPIELLSFMGKHIEGGYLLTWQTAEEINASHFDIERSKDGKIFEKIGDMKTKGSHSFYEFVDNNLPVNNVTLYYRLKLNDLDGTFEYSKVLSLANEKSNSKIKIYPTNTEGVVWIDGAGFEIHKIIVYNAVGQLVYSTKNENSIDISHLIAGTYFVQIQTASEKKVFKVLKQ